MKRFLLWIIGVALGVVLLLAAVMGVSYAFTTEGGCPNSAAQFGEQVLEANGSCWQVPLLGGQLDKVFASPATLTVLPKDFGTVEVEAEAPAAESANAQFRSAIWPLYEADATAKQWQGGFVPPAEDSMTLVDYGQIKVTNGQQGSRSNSTKLYTIPGAPCRAAANGTVVFAGNLALTGTTVVIDHGCGLRSYLYGLQELSVSKGQTVEKGQAVGALGEELTMDFKLGSRSVNPRLLFQTSGGLFWKENG